MLGIKLSHIALTLALVVAIGGALIVREPGTAHAAPVDVVEDFVAAINDGDAAAAAALFAEDGVFTDVNGGSFAGVGRPALEEAVFSDLGGLQIELTDISANGEQVTGTTSITDDDSEAAGVDRYIQPFTARVVDDLIAEFHLTYDTSDEQTQTYLDYLASQEGPDEGPPPGTTEIALGPGRDGSQPGTAFIFAEGNFTLVFLQIAPGPAGVLQPAHLHDGDCPGVGAINAPLASVLDGESFTILSMPQSEVLAGNFAINVHQSAEQASIYVACGEVGAASVAPTATPPAATAVPATATPATGIAAPDTGTGGSGGGSAIGWTLVAALAVGALFAAGSGMLLSKRTR